MARQLLGTPHDVLALARRIALAVLGALCAGAAFSLDYSAPAKASNALEHAFAAHPMRFAILSALFALAFASVTLTGIRKRIRLAVPVSLLLGAGWAVGRQFFNEYDFAGRGQELKLAIGIIGFSVFYWFLLQLLFWLVQAPWAPAPHRMARLRSFLARESFTLTFLFILAMWATPLWLHYPAGLYFDVNNELEQGFGLREYSTGHPLAHILLLTGATKAGMLIGRPDFGVFLLEVLMALILALSVAYAVRFLTRRHAPWWSYVLMCSFYGASPWILGTLGDPTKDVHYSGFVLIFVVLLTELATDTADFLSHAWRRALFVLVVTAVVLMRNNGIHIVVGTFAVLVAFLLVTLKKQAGRALVMVVLALAVPIAADSALNAWIQPEPFRAGEALSLPLQQSARLIRDHPEAIAAEEEAVLRRVLPFDKAADLYDPYTVDRLKDTARYDDAKEFERGAESEYLGVWLAELPRAPLTYLSATWQQNLFLAFPETTIHHYYVHSSNNWESKTYLRQFFLDPPTMVDTKDAFLEFLDAAHTLPVLRNLNSLALYTISVPVLAAFALTARKKRLLLPLVPVFLSVLVVIAAPGLMNFPRYAYPVIFTVPFLWAVFGAELRERREAEPAALSAAESAESVGIRESLAREPGLSDVGSE